MALLECTCPMLPGGYLEHTIGCLNRNAWERQHWKRLYLGEQQQPKTTPTIPQSRRGKPWANKKVLAINRLKIWSKRGHAFYFATTELAPVKGVPLCQNCADNWLLSGCNEAGFDAEGGGPATRCGEDEYSVAIFSPWF